MGWRSDYLLSPSPVASQARHESGAQRETFASRIVVLHFMEEREVPSWKIRGQCQAPRHSRASQ